jgi:predicted Ser/Thr protein kinase
MERKFIVGPNYGMIIDHKSGTMWKDSGGVCADCPYLVHSNNRQKIRFSRSNQIWKPEARQAADKINDSGLL